MAVAHLEDPPEVAAGDVDTDAGVPDLPGGGLADEDSVLGHHYQQAGLLVLDGDSVAAVGLLVQVSRVHADDRLQAALPRHLPRLRLLHQPRHVLHCTDNVIELTTQSASGV